ncbi:MAG: hypothetical protein ABIP55_03155 [Tepidisphaeraceae bacterium]
MRWRLRLLLSLTIGIVAGCHAQPRNSSVTMHTTTQPADRDAPRARHVELRVRDTTTSGLAGSIIGKGCRVQFRRDALGMAGASGVAPTQDYRGITSVAGRIEDMNDQWIVITANGKRYVIPHGAILLIDVQD